MNMAEGNMTIKCSLCGTVFEPAENTCNGCIVRKNCKLICCPNCGFGIPAESQILGWLKERGKEKRSA